METEKKKILRKMFVSNTKTEQMVIEIMNEKGIDNYSQAIRDAVFDYHRKLKPKYLEPTPYMKEKQVALSEEERLDKMSNEQFALEVLKGVIVKDRNGGLWVVSHGLGNSVYCTPLDKIKQWSAQDNGWFMKHNLAQLAKANTVEKAIEKNKLTLQTHYKIVFDEPTVAEHPAVVAAAVSHETNGQETQPN